MTEVTRRTALKLGLATAVGAPLVLAGTRTAQAATHRVSIEGFAFVPASISVAVGDTIVFTNNDGAPHTATADDASFDTGRLRRGKIAEVTVTAAGSTKYHCSFHPNMKGAITAA